MPEHITAADAIDFDALALPISQAVVHGDTVYVSGMTGHDPATGETVPGGVAAETRQALAHIGAICEAAGTSLERLVKVTVFIDDMADFGEVNAVYEEVVPAPHPARSALEVSDLARDFAVEIEAIAAR